MKTLAFDEADAIFDKYWDEMREEWFKIEVLQDYRGEDDGPSLQAWLKGDHQKAIELMKRHEDPGFTRDCQQKIATGVKLLRIHIIEEPLTSYMQWELEFYKQISIPLRNEQVFIINKSAASDLNIPNGDLMIFDKKRAVLNAYENGLAIQQTFYDEQDNLTDFLALRKALKARAKKLV